MGSEEVIGSEEVMSSSEEAISDSHRFILGLYDQLMGSEPDLSRLVEDIASAFDSEVSSIYWSDKVGELLLIATCGLDRRAVNETRLNFGEGLVGVVASSGRPISVAEAPKHRAFAYKPETNEMAFSSFLGVPMIHGDLVVGVLVVQCVEVCNYSDASLRRLEQAAVVIAEFLASSGASRRLLSLLGDNDSRSTALTGRTMVAGVAIGKAQCDLPRISLANMVSRSLERELEAFELAISEVQSDLQRSVSFARTTGANQSESEEVLTSFLLIASERELLRRITDWIRSGLTAQASIVIALSEIRIQMSNSKSAILVERFADIEELGNRILTRLRTGSASETSQDEEGDYVMVARRMGPGELVDVRRAEHRGRRITGVVLAEGGVTSHVAIIARSLGIPIVGGLGGAISFIEPGDNLVVDADKGEVLINPSATKIESYRADLDERARQNLVDPSAKSVPHSTIDGTPFELLVNAGLPDDLRNYGDHGEMGVGLYRTELLLMLRESFPLAREQERVYRDALVRVGDAPVYFRALDIGGDKLANLARSRRGKRDWQSLRGTRLLLARPALFVPQMRALMRATAGSELYVMFPMISGLSEFQEVKQRCEEVASFLRTRGEKLPSKVHYGAMIEMPSVLFELDGLCTEADFVSIGTNDLRRSVFGIDREDDDDDEERVGNLSVAMLRVLRSVAETANRCGCPVTVCGEMSSMPEGARALMALGITSLSMQSNALAAVKKSLVAFDAVHGRRLIENYMSSGGTASEFRAKILT